MQLRLELTTGQRDYLRKLRIKHCDNFARLMNDRATIRAEISRVRQTSFSPSFPTGLVTSR